MTRWEYCWYGSGNPTGLGRLGDEGWEVVLGGPFEGIKNENGSVPLSLLLKRPKVKERTESSWAIVADVVVLAGASLFVGSVLAVLIALFTR